VGLRRRAASRRGVGADAEAVGAWRGAERRDVACGAALWLNYFKLDDFEHVYLPKIVLKCTKR
jgi:hypothetical protein